MILNSIQKGKNGFQRCTNGLSIVHIKIVGVIIVLTMVALFGCTGGIDAKLIAEVDRAPEVPGPGGPGGDGITANGAQQTQAPVDITAISAVVINSDGRPYIVADDKLLIYDNVSLNRQLFASTSIGARAVAIDRSDNVYVLVSESGPTYRVAIFDSSQNRRSDNEFSLSGDGIPIALAADADTLYILYRGSRSSRVERYLIDDVIPPSPPGTPTPPVSTTLIAQNVEAGDLALFGAQLYISDRRNGRVCIYMKNSAGGSCDTTFGAIQLDTPGALAFSPSGQNALVSDNVGGDIRVYVFTLRGSSYSFTGELNIVDERGDKISVSDIADLASHIDGALLIADSGGDRLHTASVNRIAFCPQNPFVDFLVPTDRAFLERGSNDVCGDDATVSYRIDTSSRELWRIGNLHPNRTYQVSVRAQSDDPTVRIYRNSIDAANIVTRSNPDVTGIDENFAFTTTADINDDYIIVISGVDNILRIHSLNFETELDYISPTDVEDFIPENIAIDAENRLYVAHRSSFNNQIQVFDAGGTLLNPLTLEGNDPETDPLSIFGSRNVLLFDSDGRLIVTMANSLIIYSIATPPTQASEQARLDSSGTNEFVASGLAIAMDGTLYMADGDNNLIRWFSIGSTPTQLGQFGAAGNGNGQFMSPRGLDFGPDGRLYVADSDNNRVQVFSVTPTGLSFETEITGLSSPVDVVFDSAGRLYVSEEYARSDGTRPDGAPSNSITNPDDGQIVIYGLSDSGPRLLRTIVVNGRRVFQDLQDISFDSNGHLHVAMGALMRTSRFALCPLDAVSCDH